MAKKQNTKAVDETQILVVMGRALDSGVDKITALELKKGLKSYYLRIVSMPAIYEALDRLSGKHLVYPDNTVIQPGIRPKKMFMLTRQGVHQYIEHKDAQKAITRMTPVVNEVIAESAKRVITCTGLA